jgi:hypothetical protein
MVSGVNGTRIRAPGSFNSPKTITSFQARRNPSFHSEIVAFAERSPTRQKRILRVFGRNVADQLQNQKVCRHPRHEQSDLSATAEWHQQIDDLDSGFQNPFLLITGDKSRSGRWIGLCPGRWRINPFNRAPSTSNMRL